MRRLSGNGWLSRSWLFLKRRPLVILLFLFFTIQAAFAQNRAEYFFDTDPGIGQGRSLTIPAGDSVVINQSVPVSGLSTGFHTLYVRTRMGNRWSIPASTPFFIQTLASSTTGPITSLEYFFDTDPGVGSGTRLAVTPAVDSSVRIATVPIGSLSPGFHTLFIRAKNDAGYSFTESRTFFIITTNTFSAGPISSLEYFFDTDPGVGSGTRISVSPAADSSVRTAIIPIGSLTNGFHTLFIRARNNTGYSFTESRTFFITGSATANAGALTSLEYFFDADPGPGNGTRIALNPAADSIDRTAVIPISALSPGFHTLYIRSKNNFGYSQTEARSFYIVPSSSVSAGPVSRMEFFIDTDPGPGNGLPFPAFAAADSIDQTFVLSMPANLGQGSHKLYIRSQNADKSWSLTEAQDFTVDCGEIFVQASNNPICPDQGTVLSPTLGLSGTLQWYRNNVLIPGANSETFFANQAGTYTLSYSNGSCADTSDGLVLTETTCPRLPGSGNAASFSGGNSLISFPLGPVTAYTIECWVKFTGSPANRSLVVHTLNGPFSNWTHQIRTNAQGQFVHYAAAPGAINTQGTTIARQNEWYHVAITASNGGQGRLYVNGIQEGTPFAVSSLWASGNEYQIGSGSSGAGLDQASSPVGQIDEVRIWNAALTEAQIRERMCRKITAADPLYSNLLRYFNFDETSGNSSLNLANPSVTANWVNSPGRVTSGAPIGNQSVSAYVTNGLPTANLTFNSQDNVAVTYTGGTAGSTSGTHVYVVSEKPNTEAGIDNAGTNNRYFGVFTANIANPQYTAVYRYNGNPFVTTANKPNLALFKRTDNSFSPWANAGAINNTTANTLTVTGQSTEYMVGIATSAITAGTIGNNQSFECATSAPALLENLVSATTTSGNPIVYQWQDSTAGNAWQNVSGANSPTYQPPFLTVSHWYRRRATAGSLSALSNQVEILIPQAIAGDPSVFPTNEWNVYGYNGGDLNLGSGTGYRGFYPVNTLNINTQNQWSGNASPSAASNYQGCDMANDNFTFVLKRKGFPVGNYLLNIVDHDDLIRVYLDGNQIFEHLGCCDGHPNITLGRLDANSTLEIRVQEGSGFSQVNFTLTESDLQAGSISASQAICTTGTPAGFTSTQNAFGGPGLTITYQWQDSLAGGSWQNLPNAVSATFQAGALTETTWFRRIARNGNQEATSNAIQVTVNSIAGDPSVFPTNNWAMYAYSGGDFNLASGVTYLGFYPVSGLSVNSTNQWSNGASPSSAAGYQGCPVPVDNFIFTLKRRGFPAGQYTMNISDHDDWVRVFVNGVQVFEHLSCCDSHNGIDLGTLGANSTVEVRTLEGGGSAQIAFDLIVSDFQGGTIAANQTLCAGKAPALLTNEADASGGGVSNVAYQWQDSTAGGSWQDIQNATASTFQPGVLPTSRWYRRKASGGNVSALSNEVAITVLASPSVSLSPAGPVTLCEGEIAELSAQATPGSTFVWLRNGAVVNGQASALFFASQSGSYQVVARIGGQCADTSASVVVNVNPRPSPQLNLSGPQSICSNGSLELTHTNPQTGHINQWKRDGSPISGGSSLTLTQPGFYYLVSTVSATGCKDSTAGITLNVVSPVISPSGPIQICQGGTGNLTATNTGTATLKWLRNEVEIPGANGQILAAGQSGTYKVVAELPGLCTDTSAGVTMIVNPLPQANVVADADSFCVGGSTVLRANTGNGLSYQWKRNGSNLSNATADTLLVNTPGDYSVEVRNAANCSQTSPVKTIRSVNNLTWFVDADGDQYSAGVTVSSCTRPPNGFLAGELLGTQNDCNDQNPQINPSRQFFSFSGSTGFETALCSPLQGTPYTTFRFEVLYTDLNGNPPPPTFPRVILDYEGNGQLNNGNDRTILMQESDTRDNNYADGKRYFATVNSLPSGTNYTTRVVTQVGSCGTTFGPLGQPDVFILSDLQIFANDIVFDNPNPEVASPLQIQATVHNVSDFAAQNFVVHLRNQFDTLLVYPDITVPFLAPHSSITVTWNITTPAVPAWCPMQVFIDWTNVITETNELDNSAIRPFTNGNFNVPGAITFTPAISPATVVGVSGATTSLTGTANYSGTAVPLVDPSVAGAQVTFTVQPGGQTFTTYTNSSGQISFSFPVGLTPGVYTVTGTITDFTLTTNFTATFTVVPPVCLPDLVAILTLAQTNLVEGESTSGTLRIQNGGCQNVTDSTLVKITQSGGSPAIASFKIPPLAIGQFLDFPIPSIQFSTPGTYSLCALADGDFQIAEAAEFNNQDCDIISVIPFLPDIVPTSCGVGGQQFISSQAQLISFSASNTGGSATGAFSVRIRIFRDGNLLETRSQPIANIARQSGTSFSISYTFDTPGTYQFQTYWDSPEPAGVVTETNEANNGTNCGILILATQPDLVVASGCENIDADPDDPQFPGTITLKTRILNQGNANVATPILVRFTQSGGAIHEVTIPDGLPAGTSIDINKSVPSVAPGTETVRIDVDPLNTISEFSDNNNSAGPKSLCHEFAPVENFCGGSWWNNTYRLNQSIFLNVPLMVSGIYDASEVKVRFLVSGPGLTGTLNLGEAVLNQVSELCSCPLNAVLPTSFAFPQEGEYTFTFIADPDNAYTECDESNNTLIRKVRVSGLPDMRVLSQGINPSKLNPDVNEPITIQANYENIGLSNINQTMKFKLLMDEIAIDSATVNGLVTGDNFTVNFSTPWSSDLVGSHIIRTIIDADKVIEEANEANNEATRAVIVGAAANLYFQVFSPNNGSPAIGQTITLNTRIGNNGDEDVNALVQLFYINNQNDTIQIGQAPVFVAGNDSTLLNFNWTVVDNNTTLIGKIVNADIMEFNYDDNMATAPIGGFSVAVSSTPGCEGISTGSLQLVLNGGTAPFTFFWSNGFTGQNLVAAAGTYSVQVRDANGITVNSGGTIANRQPLTWYRDADLDGYGDPALDSVSCDPPQGYVRNNRDCNDQNPGQYKQGVKPVIQVGGDLTFCNGSSVLLSVDSLPRLVYTWSTGQTGDSVFVSLAATITVTASGDSTCPASSDPVQTQTVTNLVPTATISSSAGTLICAGTPVTFSAQTSGGGSSPLLEWFRNGQIIFTGPAYQTDSLEDGDEIQLILTSSELCANPVLAFSNELVMDVRTSLKANAGPDQEVCGTTASLAATGTGSWSLISGTGTLQNATSPTSAVSGLASGPNVLVWQLTGTLCPAESDTVVISSLGSVSPALAGGDQTLCDTVAFLDGNVPQVGTGTWSLLSGSGVIVNPNQFDSPVRALPPGESRFVWTIQLSTCPPSRDTVSIFRFEAPSSAGAGNDQTLCTDSTQMDAELPLVGLGSWRVLEGSGILQDSTLRNTRIRNLSTGQNRLVWIVRNGICPERSDTVVLNVLPAPSQADAGFDRFTCESQLTLNGNAPASGQGVWRLLSGSALVEDSLNPASVLSGIAPGNAMLTWVIQLGNCPPSRDTVVITRAEPVTPALAGADQNLCGDTARVTANTPLSGTGVWRKISGSGVVQDSLSPSTRIQELSTGTSQWAWIIENDPCPSSADTVILNVLPAASPANAGPDLEICDTTLAFSAQVPQVGTGMWTRISGSGTALNPDQANSVVTGIQPGLSVWEWMVSAGSCPVNRDTLRITRSERPSPAQAGVDQTLCAASTQLAAAAPLIGSGKWRLISGSGILADSLSPQSSLTNLTPGVTMLEWRVENGFCPASSDSVQITTLAPPDPALAGPDVSICDTVVQLQAQAVQVGTGTWSLLSGSGQILSPNDPASTFRNMGIGTTELVWTVSNGICPSQGDTLRITRFAPPQGAFAGADTAICGSSLSLSGNSPVVGVGTWSALNGNPVFENANAPGSQVSGLAAGLNQLVWTLSNGTCPVVADTVLVQVQLAGSQAIAGGNQLICDSTTSLDAAIPTSGTGLWTLISGSGILADPANPGSAVSQLGVGNNRFVWTVNNGICPSSTDTVTITRYQLTGPAQAGADVTLCGSTTVLSGNSPLVGFGQWTLLSGQGTISNPANPNATVTNLGIGENRFIWTLGNGNCPTQSDTVSITRQQGPSQAQAGADQALCSPVTNMAAQIPAIGQGVWSVLSGTASVAAPNSPTSQVSGLLPGQTILIWSVSAGVCPASTDTVVLVYAPPVPANAGPSLFACSDTIRLNGVSPQAPATGQWTLLEGGGTLVNSSLANSQVTGLATGSSVFRWTVTQPGCPSTSDTMTVVRVPDTFNLGNDTTLCPGDSFVVNLSDFFTFVVWQDGSTSLNYTIDTAGTYSVKVTTPANCVWEDTLVVGVCVSNLAQVKSKPSVRVFPNPFQRQFELEVQAFARREAHYRLITVNGVEVGRGSMISEGNLARKTIVPGELPPGLYILEVDLGESTERIKLMMR